jgi:mono/diheme cytochrome c family protein
MEAQRMKNPVEPTPDSLAAGKAAYDKHCADCHGPKGAGDGPKAAAIIKDGLPKTPDLTDARWEHGSTDGEIFVNIRDGVGVRGAMEGLSGVPGVTDTDMWNIVNYVRSLNP